jgi:hypothetical protein
MSSSLLSAVNKQYIDNAFSNFSISASTIISSLGYVPINKAGDTMVGMLTLYADPVNLLDASTKAYVDRNKVSLTASTLMAVLGYTPVNKAGDTMVGMLTLSNNPVLPLGAATKYYVDSKIGTLSYINVISALGYIPVNRAGDTMQGPLSLWHDPINSLEAATKHYVDSTVSTFSGVTSFDGRNGAVTLTYSDVISALSYIPVNKSGDSMVGSLILNNDPVLPLGAATKRYVDSHILTLTYASIVSSLGYVPVNKAGDTMNGTLTLYNDPVSSFGAATKRYVDNAIATLASVTSFNNRTGSVTLTLSDVMTALQYTPVNKAGDSMTGSLLLSADPVLPLGAATKEYVDNHFGTITASTIIAALGYVPVNKAGDSMTGLLVLSADPVSALGAATKEYVDSRTASLTYSTIIAALGYVPVNKAGDSMLGSLLLSADPTLPLGATTKEYVDARVASLSVTSVFTGDASGTGIASVYLTLANSGVTPGTYNSVLVDTKGRVIKGTLAPVTLIKYTDNPAISANGVSTYAVSTIFPNQTFDGRNCIVNVQVLDPLPSSPTYNLYISGDAVSTIATNSSTINVFNNYNSPLTFFITIVAV